MRTQERRAQYRRAGWRAGVASGLIAIATAASGTPAVLAAPLSRTAASGDNPAAQGTVSAGRLPSHQPAVQHVDTSANSASGAMSTVWSGVLNGGYTSAGIGMRNLGYGTISLTGVPKGAQVKAAYLLWDILADAPTAAYAQGKVDSKPITGTEWASGASPCWSPSANLAYEANVTKLVRGNGSYALSGFATGQSNGADPWNVGSAAPMLEGASLVVVYQRASLPRTVIQIDEGATETQDGDSAQATLGGFTARSPVSAVTTYIVADGQLPGNTASFNGTILPGVGFPGDAPQAVPHYSQGNLWDNVTANVAGQMTAGEKSATAAVTGYDDCLVWVGQVLAVAGQASRTMVSMGDSYSSGEANPPFDAGTNTPSDQCHRSADAWPRLLAAADPTVSLEALVACSGATTEDITTNTLDTEQPQIAQLKAMPQQPQIITITIGGDNVGFESVLAYCLLTSCGARLTAAHNYIENTLPGLLDSTYRAIHAAAPQAKVYVVGYPRIFPLYQWETHHCGWLTPAKRNTLNGLGVQLDKVIASAAAQAGFRFVSTWNAFSTHELCTAQSWLYPIGDTPIAYDAHPLLKGQQALAAIVRQAIG
ncbi:MAG TPA: GDSL-type esterase/lipase family protein [Streptosporangiaceae bacterium]|nr:GDSL-type esterase/lipase family protein [Streptosporangiaceae bacterium]